MTIGENMDKTIKIFKALTDKNRLRIIKMLEQKPLCVCEITSVLDISTSTVSSHLSFLKEAGFISDTKDGKWVEYSLNRSSKDPILHQILAMLPGWLNDKPEVISDQNFLRDTDRNTICST
jgi:ArsR family transcriptional regulator